MLSIFRRFSKSPIGMAIFALILVAFIVTLYEGRAGLGGMAFGSPDAVATVGSASIDSTEIARRTQNQLDGARQQNPSLDMTQFLASGGFEKTLDMTLTGRALEVFAGQQGMVASKRLVDGQIASIPAFFGPTGKFDAQTFQQALSARKVTEQMLRADFARESLTRALAIPVAGAARVPVGLVEPYASLLLEDREGQVATVPSLAFMPKALPNDAEVQGFYQRNTARYIVPERRVIRFATFDKSIVAAKSQPTDAEIQAVYTAEAAKYAAREQRSFTQIIVPTQAQANDLAAKVRGGMSMADAAKGAGRDAIAVPASDQKAFAALTAPAVAQGAFATAKGQVAPVARSGLGFHVVRVDGITTIAATPLAAVRSKIAAELTAMKETKAMGDLVAEIDDAASGSATFDEIVKKFGFTVQATPAVTAGGKSVEDATYAPPPALAAILTPAFQAEPGDDPVVTPLSQNAGYVLWKLERTVPAAAKPLAEIRAQVIADLQTDKGSKAAKVAADAIAAAVNSGTPLSQAMAKAGVALPPLAPAKAKRIQLTQMQGRVPPPLSTLFALPLHRARAIQMDGRAGWYVVAVDKITGGDAKTMPGLIEATQRELSGAIGDEYVQQFASAIRKQVGVTRNEAAIERLKKSLGGGR